MNHSKNSTESIHHMHHTEASVWPVVVILLLLTAITAGIVYFNKTISLEFIMRIYMGLFFVVFSGFKFLDYKNFADAFATYDISAQKIPGYKHAYPFIELLLGIGFLFAWQLVLLSSIVIALLSVGAYSVIKTLRHNTQIQCACLGTKIKLPLTKVTVIENMLMVSMSIAMIINIVLT